MGSRWVGVVVVAAGCSSGSNTVALLPDAGHDASTGKDAGSDARADGGDEASADTGTSDGAAPLPECDEGKTCALPLLCDTSDLLCEPPCDATHACAGDTFCRPDAPGSPSGTCIAADYQCLGNVPALPAPTAQDLTIATTFIDTSTGVGAVAPNLSVRACAKTDPPCATPVAVGTTGSNGATFLTVPAGTGGFDGYFDVTGPSSDGGSIVETLLFASVPVTTGGNLFTASVASAAALQKELAALGTFNPTRALVMVVDEACRSTPAFGASLAVSSADAATKVGYVGSSGLVSGASSFRLGTAAVAYAVNVPGAGTMLTTTYSGQTVNALAVVLRPGVLVTATLAPTP